MNIPISPSQVKLALNIFLGAVVLLACLNGFHRGTKKSLFFMICSVVCLVLTVLLSNFICDKLLEIDLSALHLSFSFNSKTFNVTTLKATLVDAVSQLMFAGQDISDTTTLNLVMAVVHTVFRFVFYIVTFILAFTLYKFFFDHIWFIFRPKKVKNENGKKRRPKPSMKSRLGGLGMGFVKGAAYCLIIFSLFAGVSSIVGMYQNTIAEVNGTGQVTVALKDGQPRLVKLDGEEVFDPLQEYSSVLALGAVYSDSIGGKVFGSIKVGGSSIDEKIFDSTLAIKGDVSDDKSVNINLREELGKVADAVVEVGPALKGGVSLEGIISLSPEQIQGALGSISEMDLFDAAVPALAEIAVQGSLFDDMLPEAAKSVLSNVNLDEIKNMDYKKELKNIGDAASTVFAVVKDNFVGEDGKLNFKDADGNFDFAKIMSMDTAAVSSIFNSLGDLEIFDVLAPVAIAYIAADESISSQLASFGIDLSTMNFDEIEDWGEEIKSLGEVYKVLAESGINIEDIMNLDFSTLTYETVDSLIDTIFSSDLISSAQGALVGAIKNALEGALGDYASYIVIPEEGLKDELRCLLKAIVAVLKTGIVSLDGGGKVNFEALYQFDSDLAEEIATYVSTSSTVRESLNCFLNNLLEDQEKLGLPFVLVGFDSADDWNKDEFYAVLNTVAIALKSKLVAFLNKDINPATTKEYSIADVIDSFKTIEGKSLLLDIAASLGTSKFLQNNIKNIVDYAITLAPEGMTITNMTTWTVDDFVDLMSIVQVVVDSNLVQDYLNKTEEDNLFILLAEDLKSPISGKAFLEKLVDAIYDCKFVEQNIDNLMGYVVTLVPYTLDNLDTWEKADVVAFVDLVQFIADKDVVAKVLPEFAISKVFGLLDELTEEDIHSFATYFSKLEFVGINIDNAFAILEEKGLKDYLINPIDAKNISWDEEEYDSILMTAYTCYKLGLIKEIETKFTENIAALSGAQIKEIAAAASHSLLIKNNLINAINSVIDYLKLGVTPLEDRIFSATVDTYAGELEQILLDLQGALAN